LVAVLPARVDDQLGEGQSRTRVDASPSLALQRQAVLIVVRGLGVGVFTSQRPAQVVVRLDDAEFVVGMLVQYPLQKSTPRRPDAAIVCSRELVALDPKILRSLRSSAAQPLLEMLSGREIPDRTPVPVVLRHAAGPYTAD